MNEAISIIKEFEGRFLQGYKCPAGIWTIGYGNTSFLKNHSNPSEIKITESHAHDLLYKDVKDNMDFVLSKIAKRDCNQNQVAALTSFCYNVGRGSFARSSLLKCIIADPSNFAKIKEEFQKWVYIGSETSRGLTRRREAEFKLYSRK